MRTLALVTDAFGGYGGVARYNQAFLRALAGLDGTTEIVVVPREGEAPAHGLPAHLAQLPPTPAKSAYIARVLRIAARRPGYDLLFCGYITMAPLAAAIARWLGCPWWLQIHGIEAWDPRDRLVRAALPGSRLVTAVSHHTRERFLAWADMPRERVQVLPNLLEPRFTPGPKPAHLLRRYRLHGRRVLLTVARIDRRDRRKGVERVIAALPALCARFPDLAYAIVGEGDDRPRLEAQARDHGVAGLVRFLGRIPDDELVEHYRMADLFVMPSTKEGFGIVFLEAMACGLPAIGGDADGSVEPLAVSPLGRAVPPGQLADAIACVLANPPRDDRLGRLAERFGPAAFAARLAALTAPIAPAGGRAENLARPHRT